MANLTAKKTLTAAALAAATILTPAIAQATDYASAYEDCRTNTDEQVLGGTIGALAGGLLGNRIAGRGDRTGGSVIGAVLGGVAGASIADGNNDCDKIRNTQVRTSPTNSGYATTSNQVYTQPRITNSRTVYSQPQVSNTRTVYTSPRIASPVYTQPVSTVYTPQRVAYVNPAQNQRHAELSRIDHSLAKLERDCEKLTRKQNRRFSHQRALELDYIAQEIAQLKRERRYIKKASLNTRRW